MEPETPAPKRNRKSKADLAMDAAIKRRGLNFSSFRSHPVARQKSDVNLATRIKLYRIEQSYDRQD